MEIITKETDKNYSWMKFKLQQTTAPPGNAKYKQPSLHPEITPFSVSVSCAKLSVTQKLLRGAGGGCGSRFGCRVPWDSLHLTLQKYQSTILFWGGFLEICSIMHNTGGKPSSFVGDFWQYPEWCILLGEKKTYVIWGGGGQRGSLAIPSAVLGGKKAVRFCGGPLAKYPEWWEEYGGREKSCMAVVRISGNTQHSI